ncbi:MAG: hypothetical protein KGQ41_09765 [Alphaproteobacteria bacterium]|nr:hypothetical protein [Alphaproteobacteria bacterium]
MKLGTATALGITLLAVYSCVAKPTATSSAPQPFAYEGLTPVQSTKLNELLKTVGAEVVANKGQQERIGGAKMTIRTSFYSSSRAETGEQIFAAVSDRTHMLWYPKDYYGVPTEKLTLHITASSPDDETLPHVNKGTKPIAAGDVIIKDSVGEAPTVFIASEPIAAKGGIGQTRFATTRLRCTMKVTLRAGDTPGANVECLSGRGHFRTYIPL